MPDGWPEQHESETEDYATLVEFSAALVVHQAAGWRLARAFQLEDGTYRAHYRRSAAA